MDYKMLVLDLDGTLTNKKKEITPYTKEVLIKAQQAGVKIVLASGRPTYGIIPLAKELELDQYNGFILAFNGGQIIECHTGKTIYQKTFEKEEVNLLDKLAKENKVAVLTYEDKFIITEKKEDKYVQIESMITHMKIKEVKSFSEYVNFPVTKCLLVEDGDYLAKVEKKIKDVVGNMLSVYRSEPYFLEIMPQNVDKAASLRRLLRYLGLSKEEMIACGDGFNDQSMIEYAGLGVAMRNAQEEVKKVADYVAPSNDEEGVAHVVTKFVLQKA